MQKFFKINIIIDFSQFEKQEKTIKKLESFSDVNRMDYASLKFKISVI
jgi:hypothetical protein